MAQAKAVLKEAIEEMALLANSGGSLEELKLLANLARDALEAGDGEIDDDRVREGGLHPASGLDHLGLN